MMVACKKVSYQAQSYHHAKNKNGVKHLLKSLKVTIGLARKIYSKRVFPHNISK